MATEIQQAAAATLTFRPPALWASVTGKVLSPAGATLESPTPSVSAVATTVASATLPDTLVLTSGTGFARGQLCRFTGVWGYAYAEIASVNGAAVTLVEPLPTTPSAGDAVRVIDVTLAITSTSTADRGIGYRATVTNSTTGEEISTFFSVVRHPWQPPVDARMVRLFVSDRWPRNPILTDEEAMSDIASRANRLLRSALLGTGVYPHLFLDPDSFEEAASIALELAACKRNLHTSEDRRQLERDLRADLDRAVADIAKSAEPYDGDDDDALSDEEAAGIYEGELYR